ncbi:hypothetical protein [Solilutibacter silvestris]|uniref:hypothetical protein n=1 Tax=Solilutibacter silvestris TaxID=1645665 RepID=UPI003D32F488
MRNLVLVAAIVSFPLALHAQDDLLNQSRAAMTANCVKTAQEKSPQLPAAKVQMYCSCVSNRLITDQASLIRVSEAGLKMMRKEPGAQEELAKLAGPAALMCASEMQGK